MTISRRTLMKSGAAAGAMFALPSVLRAQTNQTVRMIMGDIQIFDPVFTTSDYTLNHAMAIYDTLFAMDADLRPQPQMVGAWNVSEDKKTYTFELRDGLSWHDGTRVMAADCVASIRRWGQVEPHGQLLLERVADIAAIDETAFKITLHEPFDLVLETLATAGKPLFVMREQDATLPATKQVTTNIGSGPFKFNAELTRPGSRVVYDRNKQYLPRNEPASGFAGGKVVNFDQVIWDNISDPQTALAALQAGEVDFWLEPVADLFLAIESDPNFVPDTLGKGGADYFVRINCLQPPFDNVKMRQALLHLIDQNAFLKLLSTNPKAGRTVQSAFGTGSPYSNDVNTGWFKVGGDLEKAKQLIAESGYAGEKAVILDPTDWSEGHLASQLLANVLQKAGINAELAPMTWSELIVRVTKKEPVEEGGWTLMLTSTGDFTLRDPMSFIFPLNGEKAWRGWPQSEEFEALRSKWPDTATLEERQELAKQMQRVWWDYVPQIFLCQTLAFAARNKSLVDMINFPAPAVAMWNMRKV
ncbi:ABC transporter substrate-binding protein [Sinorhizobium medicae]